LLVVACRVAVRDVPAARMFGEYGLLVAELCCALAMFCDDVLAPELAIVVPAFMSDVAALAGLVYDGLPPETLRESG